MPPYASQAATLRLTGCHALPHRLPPCASQAATGCEPGCSPVPHRLPTCASQAATLCIQAAPLCTQAATLCIQAHLVDEIQAACRESAAQIVLHVGRDPPDLKQI